MDRSQLTAELENALAGRQNLEALAERLGYGEPARSASNLNDLHQALGDPSLLADLALDALESADPDTALNNLERLVDNGGDGTSGALLADRQRRSQLLTVLGASSYLAGILCRSAAHYRQLFGKGEIDTRKFGATMLAELRQAIPDDVDFAELQQGLRLYKQQEILRIGARDLCGFDDLPSVTRQLAELADVSLQRTCEICDRLMRSEYGVPMEQEDKEELREARFTVLGMGKLGGLELNFSSDIDLLYFYSSERGTTTGVSVGPGEPRNRIPLHNYFVKLAELLTRAIGQVTEDGFVFRVDLDLRPEGRTGEIVNSQRSAEVYYESWGRSWERAAMLKARPVAGCLELGQSLLEGLEPFIYRRYLDYGMIEDIKGMKQKIDRSLAMERGGQLDLKLGRGGIREIEFFIQTLQLIYAGKNPALRERNSLKALDLLLAEKLIGKDERDQLQAAYIFLRRTEHRIQIFQERQTQTLPSKPEDLTALARRCGFSTTEPFLKALESHREAVHAIFHDLFYTPEEEIQEEVRPEIFYLFDPNADRDRVLDILEGAGFKDPEEAYRVLLTLRDGPVHSHFTEKARRQLERIAPLLAQATLDCHDPTMALGNLERFLNRLRARGTFYALLAENREIIKTLVNLFSSSQFLSRIFIQHPEILDSLVSRSYAVVVKEKTQMREDLESLLRAATDYEASLDMLRRFKNEEFLRIALNDISGGLHQGEGAQQLSELAEICLEKAVEMAREELIPRFGLPFCPGPEKKGEHQAVFAIVGMGKLGGRELNYHSDLDIIFVYEGEGRTRPVEGSDDDRFREQSNREYFARLAQRIISILSLMTREGKVYEIDTRLRPSGNQGPLVTSISAFEGYHRTSAQPWERQALTKARPMTGPPEFIARIEELLRELVFERPLPEHLREEIFRLRNRMETEIARESGRSFNIKTGRGGLVDVEFIAQYLQLRYGREYPVLRTPNTLEILNGIENEGLLDPSRVETLRNGYKFLRRLENKLRILHDHSISEISADRTYLRKLARTLGYTERPRRPEEAFVEDYQRITGEVRKVFNALLGPETQEDRTDDQAPGTP